MADEQRDLIGDLKDEVKSAAGAKGGRARAEALSPTVRSEIAAKAAAARWGNDEDAPDLPEAAYGSPDRPLRLGSVEIPCYVLGDGRRVIVQRGMTKALDISRGSAAGGHRIANLAATKAVNPFVSDDLRKAIESPIRFRAGYGRIGHGYEATVLADLCDAVLSARKAGKLLHHQQHIADQCEMLVRSFAKVGIIALVDEATGYQEIRQRDALAKILEKFIATELRKWVRTFPIDYYQEMCRLRGWAFDPSTTKRAPLVGKLTNNLIYLRLAPGVLEELKRLTPRDDKGRPKTKLFQRLTEDVGHPRLREHLSAVVALMKAAPDRDWGAFMKMLDRALPKYPKRFNPDQLPLRGFEM